MNIWLHVVNVPDNYIGESYFIINGAIELYKPAHIPCNILPINRNWIFGMNKMIPAIIANPLTINNEFLRENL